MKYDQTIQVRVSRAEMAAFTADAQRRGMALSQWVRSGLATYLVCGKRTVIVPAAPEPAYVKDLRKNAKDVVQDEAPDPDGMD